VPKDFEVVQRLDRIKDLCAGRRVLHLGCTNHPYTLDSISAGTLLHFELEKTASEIWGLDSDAEGIELLRSNGSENLVLGDLEHLETAPLDDTFDIIVAGEMIEHLDNPGLFLSGVKRFMRADTILVLTTINAYCAMRFFYYGARGRRGLAEPVHPDHVAYYSYSTLKLMLDRHGLRTDRFLYYDIGNEHRPHTRWFLKAINDVCVRLVPQWADGLIAECRLSAGE